MNRKWVVLMGTLILVLAAAIPAAAIVNGEPDNGEHPYVAQLVFYNSGEEWLWACSGALLSDRLILTAAHCLYDQATGTVVDASQIQFLAGWRNGRATAYRGARTAIPHPEYHFGDTRGPETVDRDLALIRLEAGAGRPAIYLSC